MTKWQLTAIGFFILVVVPTLLGLLVARFWGWEAGAFIGGLSLGIILFVYDRKMKGVKAQENDRRHNHNKE